MALGIHSAGYCGAARRLYGSSKTRWRIVAAATPDGATEAEIRVCVNRTCGRQGSREILAVFSSICPPGVSVISCGCLGRCGGGPNLAVLPAGALIGHCGTAAKAAQILAEICGPGFDPRRNLEALALSKEAEAALEKGNAAEAESLLSQAIDLQPSGGVHLIYKSRSSVRLTMGDKIGALEDAKRASLLAPNFAQAYICEGDVLLAMEEWNGAEEAYSVALQLDPSIRRSKSFKARVAKLQEKLVVLDASS
ncbi:uncharacterized protein LOC122018575 [Zingiber officinale]|uniref:uncharacterized protein LOC122018575 n=1 Tax=Zingiber officinale TaxID=94328 RepID=UPI001C4AF8E5|nr:uncharacterized protein LOC122018575 [Zingiber officinale]